MKLHQLKQLKLQIDAIYSQRALGLKNDLRLGKLGRLAVDHIDYEIKFDMIRGKKKLIESEVLDTLLRDKKEGVTNALVFQTCHQREDYRALNKEENEVWESEVEFDFKPVEVPFSDIIYDRFKDDKVQVTFRDATYSVNPYLSLQALIEQDFITIQE
ncbi:hypothetical protein [Dyadobacter sp. CY323]|uniref:hypothetical protein n=1 Tax=Dyadobacter sp. CY323 TaxID=2907302 RepID=UPI001F438B50|nr:hypothetical protein [Dyadobacter sp. CY323]MCE6992108.1 hypothetical protein [Dyadobacter sp. CY323]